MKVAVVGSRSMSVPNLESFLPEDVTEIISGGAKGVDHWAREYANRCGLKLTEFLPEYKKYGKFAPLYRNLLIVEEADLVLAFWDGFSSGTRFVIDQCKKDHVPVRVFLRKER